MAEILEALEMTGPWSVSTSNGIPWTLAEHEEFVRGLRLYPQGPYEAIAKHIKTKDLGDVLGYGLMCWRSEVYQELLIRRAVLVSASAPGVVQADEMIRAASGKSAKDNVKVEHVELPLPPSENASRNQVLKWRRTMLEWCIHTLSCHRPERQEHAISTALLEDRVAHALFPIRPPKTREHEPRTILRAQRRRSAYSGEPKPALSTARRAGSERYDDAISRRSAVRFAPGRDEEKDDDDDDDEDDDLGMRAARRSASEIEWFNAMTEHGLLPVPSRDTLKKIGVWSSNEHERYCAALKLYRYGSWSQIANRVGSRTERQVMSHAQSIRAKRKRVQERQKHHDVGATSRKIGDLGDPTSAKCWTATASRPQQAMINLLNHDSAPTPTFAELLSADPLPSHRNSGDSNCHFPDAMNFTTACSSPNLGLVVDLQSGDHQETVANKLATNPKASDEVANDDRDEDPQPPPKRSKPNPDIPLSSPRLDVWPDDGLSEQDLLDFLDVWQE